MKSYSIRLSTGVMHTCILFYLGLIAFSTASADKLIDRGYDIPRTPRNDKGAEYFQLDIKMSFDKGVNFIERPLIRMQFNNPSSSAICIPTFTIPSRGGLENDIMTVVDLETMEVLPFKELEGVEPRVINTVKILPPGESIEFVFRVRQRYDLVEGKTYEAKYDMEAFYCDAFERGYPYAELAYRSDDQKATEYPFFQRSPRTTVKLKANLTFTMK